MLFLGRQPTAAEPSLLLQPKPLCHHTELTQVAGCCNGTKQKQRGAHQATARSGLPPALWQRPAGANLTAVAIRLQSSRAAPPSHSDPHTSMQTESSAVCCSQGSAVT